MKSIGELLFIISLALGPGLALANVLTPVFPNEGVMKRPNNTFIDPEIDYAVFMGRVTDKDDSGKVLKVYVENNNTKFLKTGDVLYFKVNNQDRGRFCRGNVRSVEDHFFSMYVVDFNECWKKDRYFPRGLQLNFNTPKMAQRVFEASKYRELLILRKENFLKQLNDINQFLWTFDQQKLKTAAIYDEQINELLREKQLALDNLLSRKQESLMLQTELIKKLDSLDESLDHYKVERQEHITDRWFLDHDSGLPMLRRPQKLKKR